MSLRIPKNALVCERSLPVLAEVRIVPRTKDSYVLTTKEKATEFGLSLDLCPKFWVTKIGPDSTKRERTSIGSNHKIPTYESQSGVDQTLWRGMIGRLLSPTTSCSDIHTKREVRMRC